MTRLAARLLAAVGATMLLSSCTGESRPTTFHDPDVPTAGLRLVAFNNCDDLLDGLRSAAKAAVGPYGFGGATPELSGRRDDSRAGAAKANGGAPAPAVAAPGAAPTSGTENAYSTTNTHEAGVDEPDLVKTDGKRIVTVAGGVLRVVDAAGQAVTGTLDVAAATTGKRGKPYGITELLLSGDHALLLGQQYPVEPDNGQYRDATPGPSLTLVDLTGQPRVLGRYSIDGSLVDARQVGSTARVVVRSTPRLRFPADGYDNKDASSRTDANRRAIDNAPIEAWLPRYSVVGPDGATSTGRVDCTAVSRPAEYSGAAMLTVLSFNLDGSSLGDGDPVTLVADGETVYANGPSLYIANDQRWRVMWDRARVADRTTRPKTQTTPKTQLYKFDISGTAKPRFIASGEVDGWLLNQYSMSEWDGRLRVATTLGQPWDRSGSTESTIYVLALQGRQLTLQGSVGGLGKGERIYAVRFIGTTGYVVTFRQTDPLYTIDLRDPKAPKVTGELKITGYSAYLHPAGEDRLIGIGQEANERGRAQGTQVSLFDVHDPTKPTRLAQYHMSGAHSEAEFDPHAFLYWPQTGLLVVPVYAYSSRTTQAALVLSVQGTAITEVGQLTHANRPIRRSLVINQTLWTVSESGLKANNLKTLEQTAWLPF